MPYNIISVGSLTPKIHPTVFIDPMARVMGDVTMNENSAVLFGSIIRGDDDHVEIGKNSVILENSLVEAPKNEPVAIGNNVLVSHGAIVHGAIIGEYTLVGIGAIVLDKAEIGEYSIVAAGAVVPPGKRVPPRTIVAGVPAKPVREVTGEDIEMIRRELDVLHRKIELYKEIFRGQTATA